MEGTAFQERADKHCLRHVCKVKVNMVGHVGLNTTHGVIGMVFSS